MQTASWMTCSPRRIWIGRSLVAVAAIHAVVGMMLFGPALRDIVQHGVFYAIDGGPWHKAAIGFMLFGGPVALMGMCIDNLENLPEFPLAKPVAGSILLTCLLALVLMPASGF